LCPREVWAISRRATAAGLKSITDEAKRTLDAMSAPE
jgi:hypothetical protein